MDNLFKFKILIKMLSYNFKNIYNSKRDFLLGFIFVFVNIFITLTYIEILFNNIQSLGDWNKYEIILLYIFSSSVISIYNIFYGNLRSLKKYIFNGELELIMTKPLDIIFHLRIKEFDIYNLITIIYNIFIFIYIRQYIYIEISFENMFIILISLFISISLISSIMLIGLSFLFYTRYTYTPYDSLMSVFNSTQYPINIFPKSIRYLLLNIIPISFIAFVPVNSLINKEIISISSLPIVIVIILHFVSRKIFYSSLLRYDGLGN